MPSGARSVTMWMLSLLMNRETMKELENDVELIIIVTCSKHITDSVRSSVGKLNNVLKCFKDDISSEAKKYIETECSDSFLMATKQKQLPKSEEELHLKCDVSPFKIHFKQIFDEKLKLLSNEDVENFPNNKLCSQHFITEF